MILCDSAPLVTAGNRNDPLNRTCIDLFTGLRLPVADCCSPATVTAEVGYLIERYGGPRAEAQFLAGVATSDFEPVELTADDYARMAELVAQYEDLPLGTTDASVIALAERLNITEIATLDRRHFIVVRPRHVRSFTLLPE